MAKLFIPKSREQLVARELGSSYLGPEDRFVVSLILGWSPEEGIATARQALAATLELLVDADGAPDTQWYVYDRLSGQTYMLPQKTVDGLSVDDLSEDEEEDELATSLAEAGVREEPLDPEQLERDRSMRDALRARFPALGTQREMNGGDTVDILTDWYSELSERLRKRKKKEA